MKEKRKRTHRATLRTDPKRVLICGIGCFFFCSALVGFLDKDHEWPVAGLIIAAAIGLLFIGVGLFANPKTVEEADIDILP